MNGIKGLQNSTLSFFKYKSYRKIGVAALCVLIRVCDHVKLNGTEIALKIELCKE